MALTNEDLLAISQLLDVKLKAEITPIKNEMQALRSEIHAVKGELQAEIQAVKGELRAEIYAVKGELQAEIQAVKGELQAEIYAVKGELQAEIQAVKGELQAEIQAVKGELQAEIHQIKLFQENIIMPQLNTIQACYTSTYDRYKDSVEGYEALKADNEVMKKVIMEHSDKLKRLA